MPQFKRITKRLVRTKNLIPRRDERKPAPAVLMYDIRKGLKPSPKTA